jgi:hypothetical protein
MQISHSVRQRTVWGARQRSMFRALQSFNASAPRQGAIARQCRRCLIGHNGVATMAEFKAWAYAGREHRHWQYWNIKRALKRLGAKQIGRAGGRARPAIYAIR